MSQVGAMAIVAIIFAKPYAISLAVVSVLVAAIAFLFKQQSHESKEKWIVAALRQSKELGLEVEKRTAQVRQANDQLQNEVAERRKAEEEVRFLQNMTQAISESSNFHSALQVTLQSICNFTRWEFGEAWIPDPDEKVLEYSPAWYGTNQDVEKFRQASEKFTFAPATGLPGRVWSLKQPEWIHDVSTESETVFLRKHVAQEVGFKTGLGIPIVNNDERVLAVLVFFMFECFEENKRLVKIVSTVAAQLSSLIQHKQAEEELRQSEERFRLLLENAKDYAIFMLDPNGHIISWNRGAERIKGYQADEIIGAHFSCFYPEDDIALGQPANHLRLCQTNGQVEDEGWRVRKDGARIWVNVTIAALRDSDGKLCGFSNVTRDITERKQAEAALHSSIATNRALLNAIPDWMFRISSNGTFVNFKAAKGSILPLPQSEFLGKNLCEVLPLEVAKSIMGCIGLALATSDTQILEYQLLVNDQLFDYEARIAVSAEDEVMAIIRDITKRKQVEADMRAALEKEKQLNELKSRFISMASHEFRTPLTTILSSAELIEHYSSKWSEEKKINHLQRIRSSVKHMTDLLNDVLLIGKAEAGKLEFNPTLIDISQFCRELVEGIQLTASNHEIVFYARTPCINDCIVDEKILRHILSNLLSNAIKYSPQGSTVNFDLMCEQDKAIFRIQDRGIGIPIEDRAQLFNSFHRANNVGTISGTGLGLAIVKKSVDVHGGEITFESELGVGTTFIVTLPLNKQV